MTEGGGVMGGAARPVAGIPLYIDEREPAVQDAAKSQPSNVWLGANNVTFKLLRCLESVRDLSVTLEDLARSANPLAEKRRAKRLATPIYSLASGVRDMFNELEGNAKEYGELSRELKKRALDFEGLVPLQKAGPLRIVRDKVDAHVDKDSVMSPEKYWIGIDLLRYLHWVRACLSEIQFFLTLDVYAWSRESGRPDVCSLMSVDGTVVDLCTKDGEPELIGINFAKSPKSAIDHEIRDFIAICDQLIEKSRRFHR